MASLVSLQRASVFPACAGMNRWTGGLAKMIKGVPRVRGDEPVEFEAVININQCSPRARG